MGGAVLQLLLGLALLGVGAWQVARRYADLPKPGDAGRIPTEERAKRWARARRDPWKHGARLTIIAIVAGLALVSDALRVLLP